MASIHASLEALEGLFAQLLDLSRLEAGALRPAPTGCPARAAVRAVSPPISRRRRARAGSSLRIVPTRLAVDTDPVLLERILRNLVANAIRYTRSGGIVLGARRRGDGVRIDVIDTGVGIDDDDRARVFDEFVQLARRRGTMPRGRGMGLGLAIVRRLAALLGHRIELASRPGPRLALLGHRAGRDPAAAAHRRPMTAAATHAARRIAAHSRDAMSSSSTTIRPSWRRCARSSPRGTRTPPAAPTRVRRSPRSLRPGCGERHDVDLIIADLRLADGAIGHRRGRPAARRRWARCTPALIVSGDTSDAAQAEARPRAFTCC